MTHSAHMTMEMIVLPDPTEDQHGLIVTMINCKSLSLQIPGFASYGMPKERTSLAEGNISGV